MIGLDPIRRDAIGDLSYIIEAEPDGVTRTDEAKNDPAERIVGSFAYVGNAVA